MNPRCDPRHGTAPRLAGLLGAAAALVGACRSEPEPPESRPTRVPEVGSSIVVGGRHVWIGAPVVLWFDPGGYDGYSTELCFPDEPSAAPDWVPPSGLRYEPGRETARGRATRRSPPEEIAALVDQLVLHYDACGTSRQCFKVLHDRRGLSVHFLLDVDGTLYQTLDLAETAWHARAANERSIGVEIANIGAHAPRGATPLDDWYETDELGTRLVLPPEPNGVRTAGFTSGPARAGPLVSEVNGAELAMHDFTPEQYETLARLTVALCRAFPGIAPDAPRDPAGRVPSDALPAERWESFRGILGHQHLARDKYDPGPAFDWESYLTLVRSGLSAAR